MLVAYKVINENVIIKLDYINIEAHAHYLCNYIACCLSVCLLYFTYVATYKMHVLCDVITVLQVNIRFVLFSIDKSTNNRNVVQFGIQSIAFSFRFMYLCAHTILVRIFSCFFVMRKNCDDWF